VCLCCANYLQLLVLSCVPLMFQYSDVYLYQAGYVHSANILLLLLPGCVPIFCHLYCANIMLLLLQRMNGPTLPILCCGFCQTACIYCTVLILCYYLYQAERLYFANILLLLLPDCVPLCANTRCGFYQTGCLYCANICYYF
jgi:hypothetical protein